MAIGDQSLGQKSDADYLAEVLQQPHPRLHVNARVKIAEMHSQDDAGYDESGANQAAVVKEKGDKIRSKVPIGREEEATAGEYDFREE